MTRMKQLILCSVIFCSLTMAMGQKKKNKATKPLSIEQLTDKFDSLGRELRSLRETERKHTEENKRQSAELQAVQKLTDSLQQEQKVMQEAWSKASGEIKSDLSAKYSDTAAKYSEVSTSLSKSLWVGLGVSVALLLLGGLGYFFLGRRQKQDHGTLLGELERSRRDSEEKIVSEFSKYTELLQEQAEKLKTVETDNTQSLPSEVDHSLALKLASEINTIERNVRLMDEGTRGLKQLRRSVDKLKDNLLANGYEMPILLGKTFVQGMNVQVASTLQDENLDDGVELITKILVPQVNYQGKMIQVAQVEISVG